MSYLCVQPQVEVRSFPSEPIQPVAANREGTYIVGGGVSGDIYLWEVNFLYIIIVELVSEKLELLRLAQLSLSMVNAAGLPGNWVSTGGSKGLFFRKVAQGIKKTKTKTKSLAQLEFYFFFSIYLKTTYLMLQVATGRQLRKWNAHYRAVTCLVFSDDDSLLISGSEDGSVKVWSLFMYFSLSLSIYIYIYMFTIFSLIITFLIIYSCFIYAFVD